MAVLISVTEKKCPARDVDCRKCNKHGHFEKVCHSTVQAECAVDTPIDAMYLDTFNSSRFSDTWSAEVRVNDKPIEFRIDTGADATCLLVDVFEQLLSAPLSPTDKALCGPNRTRVNVISSFTAVLECLDKKFTQIVYVL